MKIIPIIFLIILISANLFAGQSLSDVKKRMISESISSYSGNCPCPYSTTKRGRRCGKRSAYSKPGGAEPLCYERDITDAEARKYLEKK